MSEEKKEEVKKETQENNIQISDDVVAVVAGIAAAEVPGVSDMAGGFAGGISEVLSGKKNMSKGIKVEISEKSTKIDVNIIVEYGARIPDVAFEIQRRVKKSVENMTGLIVEEVNVHVQGVSTASNKKKENKEETSKDTTKKEKEETKSEDAKKEEAKEEVKKEDNKKTSSQKSNKK